MNGKDSLIYLRPIFPPYKNQLIDMHSGLTSLHLMETLECSNQVFLHLTKLDK